MANCGVLRIDYSHVGRRETGIERVTRELFGADALASIPFSHFRAPAKRSLVVVAQLIVFPIVALFKPRDVFVFPGFPPSPLFGFASERSILYVHDLFLLRRRKDLNFAGRFYLAPLFGFALKKFRYFFVNSEKTARELRTTCRQDAQITVYRPPIRNVFDLSVGDRVQREFNPKVLRVAAIGTVEPRKNYLSAADICASLARLRGGSVEFNIIGRPGWGGDWDKLAERPCVILHGALSDEQVRHVIESVDIFISSSHDEGLGLPLLEVQYAGLPTVAPDQDVFREVLGVSGIYTDMADPEKAAAVIMKACSGNDWRYLHVKAAKANVQRWNDLAANDKLAASTFLRKMLARQAKI